MQLLNVRRNLTGLLAASIVANFGVITAASADEGGVSMWLPGIYGSLAATPIEPGWALAAITYNTNVSAGADVARAREITIGQFHPNLKVVRTAPQAAASYRGPSAPPA